MKNLPSKLNIGCGMHTDDNWLNIDASWNAWFAKHKTLRGFLGKLRVIDVNDKWPDNIFIYDVRRGLPFEDDYFKAIYASHFLEHLYLEEARYFLKECHRVLDAGGIIRLMVPDLEDIIKEYLDNKNKQDKLRADIFMERLKIRDKEPPKGNLFMKLYRFFKDIHSHKWMYDFDSLSFYLKEAGFINISRKEYRDSLIEGIDKVEFNQGLIVEATKL